MENKLDREFQELEGKIIEKVVRHDGNLFIKFKNGGYTGIYNRAEVIEGNIELAFRNYDLK